MSDGVKLPPLPDLHVYARLADLFHDYARAAVALNSDRSHCKNSPANYSADTIDLVAWISRESLSVLQQETTPRGEWISAWHTDAPPSRCIVPLYLHSKSERESEVVDDEPDRWAYLLEETLLMVKERLNALLDYGKGGTWEQRLVLEEIIEAIDEALETERDPVSEAVANQFDPDMHVEGDSE